MTRTFSFYGVTTGSSSILRLFPRWADRLGLDDVTIAGTDLPIHADPGVYRARIDGLKGDPAELGALVTTHKIDLFRACRDQFDEIDPLARLCGEVSCLSKRDGRLRAHAKDPISCGRALAEILPDGYWAATGGHVLCLGAGGSAIAIALHLLDARPPADRPVRLVVADPDAQRLTALREILDAVGAGDALSCVATPPSGRNDELLAALPPESLVINATGRGKDTPGSPLGPSARFPERAVVWELNYRGELEFLAQARAQAAELDLTVHDGWTYFIHGWTTVIEEVFDLTVGPAEMRALIRIADDLRTTPAAMA